MFSKVWPEAKRRKFLRTSRKNFDRALHAGGSFLTALLRDSDSYVFLGIALLGAGVGGIAGLSAGLIAAGALLFAFGIWVGFWHLTAIKAKEEN